MESRIARSLLSLLLLLCVGKVQAAEPPAYLQSLDQLMAAGDWETALAAAVRTREGLPPADRLTAWEIDFRGQVLRVIPGQRYLYYQLSIPNSSEYAPGRREALPSISASSRRSPPHSVLICWDMVSGKLVWSRNLEGGLYLAVDPKSDELYVWNEDLLALKPENGEIILRRELPDRGLRGLKLGKTVAISVPSGIRRLNLAEADIPIYDVVHGTINTDWLSDAYLLSPDESCRLEHKSETWKAVDPVNQRVLWDGQEVPLEYPPLWQTGSFVTASGKRSQLGAITSFATATGITLWKAHLGWGLYITGQHRGGSSPDEVWRPLLTINDQLLALDGSGRFVLLQPHDGSTSLTVQLARDHLREPRLVNDNLVVCSFQWLRAFPFAHLQQPTDCPEAVLRLLEARCLLALKQSEEALATIEYVVERSPNHRQAWAVRADICRARELHTEESFSRTQALTLAGEQEDAALGEGWGLVRLFDLKGKPTWEVQQVGNHVYAGTQAGQLWSVQLDTLEARLDRSLPHEIKALHSSASLNAMMGNSVHTEKPLALAPAKTKPVDGVPREWYTEGGPFGRAITYRGRQFRAIRGGGVHILAGTELRKLPAVLEGMDEWEIHLSPRGPLGHGRGGVFELDDNLQPQRVLYRPLIGSVTPERVIVDYVCRSGETIGIVVSSSEGAALQIISREGKLLAEASLERYLSNFTTAEQLIAVEDGYLFSDRQLTWLSANPARSWHFGPAFQRTSGERWGDRWRYFGSPLVAGEFLFVTSLDGQLMVFDTTKLRATARAK